MDDADAEDDADDGDDEDGMSSVPEDRSKPWWRRKRFWWIVVPLLFSLGFLVAVSLSSCVFNYRVLGDCTRLELRATTTTAAGRVLSGVWPGAARARVPSLAHLLLPCGFEGELHALSHLVGGSCCCT